MTWQDITLMVLNGVFCVSLMPTIWGGSKPPLSTSLTTGPALITVAAVYTTLGLWGAAAVQLAVGVQWLILAWQRHQMQDELQRAQVFLDMFPCYHSVRRASCWYFQRGRCRCQDIVEHNARQAIDRALVWDESDA
jgi:hypothetical protein